MKVKVELNLRDTKKEPPADGEEVLAFYLYPTDGECYLAINHKGDSVKNSALYVPMSELQKEIEQCKV